MLGKLKISCSNRTKGCEQIILLDNLNDHIKLCSFNGKICKICQFEILDGHNCVKCLREANKKLEDVLENASIRIKSLEKENQNYLQTIQNISNTNPEDIYNSFKVLKIQPYI